MEQIQKHCDQHNVDTKVNVKAVESNKLSHIALQVTGDCGCDFGVLEAELKLRK